jgi:glycerol-3-phosphate dehydrogenase (NAD(P)+)
MKTVAILGEGAWGTAVATILAHNGYTVNLWCHDPGTAQTIMDTQYNVRYLPDIKLSTTIIPTQDLREALKNADYIFEAIPVQYLRSVVEQVKVHAAPCIPWVVLSKGIEQSTRMVASQIIRDIMGNTVEVAVIAGPSFAHEVAREEVTGFVVAAEKTLLAQTVAQMLINTYTTCVLSHDLYGIQLSSALKNVVAVGIGILQGAGYGSNTQALFLVRMFEVMKSLVESADGSSETVYGLAGLGDLVLTAYGSQSRNVMVGKRLGAGQKLQQILDETGAIPEGINTLKSLCALAQQCDLVVPLIHALQHVVAGDAPPSELVTFLLTR